MKGFQEYYRKIHWESLLFVFVLFFRLYWELMRYVGEEKVFLNLLRILGWVSKIKLAKIN